MAEKLKDILFPKDKVEVFASLLKKYYPSFESTAFVEYVCDDKWKERELKEKMRHATIALKKFLPDDYEKSIGILWKLVPHIKGFEAIVLPDFVEVYGQDHWDISLPALGEFTKCGSSEFGIRPFLINNLEVAMEYMLKWADDADFRVRRFASEGCRPALPWAMGIPALKKDPSLIFPILEKLKNDPEEFVRKSVANNLNDISKTHPEKVLEICKRWQGKSKNTDWIIKHACRTLLKKGNKEAMLLFGFANPEKMGISNFELSDKQVIIGNTFTFNFKLNLETKKEQKVRLEYKVHFVKASGKSLPKVFQMKEVVLKPGNHDISKKHSFENMSTRKHYPGIHLIEIIVNGVSKAQSEIEVLPSI